ncbi:PPC domain-containing protein [Paenibacillus ehimensis]|uniref:PPC domain-containing protein n=1 Tax=Paenibacillus ehimensis TaxID=79264 RepID=A0ABT8VGP8_9BACL|nr:PPC domain-containing protein [Paenibacillus ehimensis]MDO3680163.1 PPC domain-containing protein [Paenibacillus ehimensis]
MAPTASFAKNIFEERERNDSFSTANLIPELPVAIFGERNGVIDNDYFEFKAPSSGKYVFSLHVGSNSDSDLYLYDSAKQRINESTDNRNGGNEYFEQYLQKGETYYVQVGHSSGYNEKYELNIYYKIGNKISKNPLVGAFSFAQKPTQHTGGSRWTSGRYR